MIIFTYCFPVPLLLQIMPLKKLGGMGVLFFKILHNPLPVIVLKYQPTRTIDVNCVLQCSTGHSLPKLVTTTALPVGLEKHIQFTPFLYSSLANVPSGIFLNENENNLCCIPKLPWLNIFLIIQSNCILNRLQENHNYKSCSASRTQSVLQVGVQLYLRTILYATTL